MSTENIINKKKGRWTYFGSITFLLIVVASTVSLHFYNNHLMANATELQDKITQVNTNISELSKDKSLEIFALINANKKTLDIMQSRSKVTTYIKHMRSISGLYDIEFRGFEVSGSQISTNAFVRSDDNGIAYKKLVKFIENYRNNENSLFELSFINRVLGYDDMKLGISFKIKD